MTKWQNQEKEGNPKMEIKNEKELKKGYEDICYAAEKVIEGYKRIENENWNFCNKLEEIQSKMQTDVGKNCIEEIKRDNYKLMITIDITVGQLERMRQKCEQDLNALKELGI